MIPVKSKPNAMFRDVMFPRAFRHLFDDFFPEQGNQENNRGFFFQPGVDIMEHETSFDIQVSIPGMKKEDIKIETKGDEMIISEKDLISAKRRKAKYITAKSAMAALQEVFTCLKMCKKTKLKPPMRTECCTLFCQKAKAPFLNPFLYVNKKSRAANPQPGFILRQLSI